MKIHPSRSRSQAGDKTVTSYNLTKYPRSVPRNQSLSLPTPYGRQGERFVNTVLLRYREVGGRVTNVSSSPIPKSSSGPSVSGTCHLSTPGGTTTTCRPRVPPSSSLSLTRGVSTYPKSLRFSRVRVVTCPWYRRLVSGRMTKSELNTLRFHTTRGRVLLYTLL